MFPSTSLLISDSNCRRSVQAIQRTRRISTKHIWLDNDTASRIEKCRMLGSILHGNVQHRESGIIELVG